MHLHFRQLPPVPAQLLDPLEVYVDVVHAEGLVLWIQRDSPPQKLDGLGVVAGRVEIDRPVVERRQEVSPGSGAGQIQA